MTDPSQDSQCPGRDSNRVYFEYSVFETFLKIYYIVYNYYSFIKMNSCINNIFFLFNSNDNF
jgi:hypothetical protein